MRTPVYVAIAIALIVAGIVGALTIGAPFFLTGVIMLAPLLPALIAGVAAGGLVALLLRRVLAPRPQRA